jgi:hypothetical protein
MDDNKEHPWQETSEEGFGYENECLKDINNKKYPVAYRNLDKEKYKLYDIILFDGKIPIVLENHKKVECKFDKRGLFTGNICIEVGCNGIASGLITSEAEYWIICDSVTEYLIKKSEIHRCIVENINIIRYEPKYLLKQEGGIYKEMSLYLINSTIFTDYCLEIKDRGKLTYEKMI